MKRIKQYNLYIITAFLGLLLTTSCVDSMLDQNNPNGINKRLFFENLDQSENAINTVYATMRNHWVVSAKEESLRSDLAWPGRRLGNVNTTDVFYNQNFLNVSSDISKKWAAYYQGIFRANQVIEGLNKMLPKLDQSNEDKMTRWKQQMGEAKFFRGLFHFYANSLFNHGNVIIRDTVPVRIKDFNTKVSPSDAVIKFFTKDLEFAYSNLPEIGSMNGKVTKGTAATILGTSKLYQRKYKEAIKYFDDVINSGVYHLERDTAKMFTEVGEFNSESIFEVAFSANIKPEGNMWDETSMHNRWATEFAPTGTIKGRESVVPAAWLAYKYTNEKIDTLNSINKYYGTYPGVKYREISLRAKSMVALATDFETKYYTQRNVSVTDALKAGPVCWKKYTNYDITDSENTIMGSTYKSPRNVVMNRLSDVYLMKAECELFKNGSLDAGDAQAAIDLINKIRERWALVLLGKKVKSSEFNDANHTFDDKDYSAKDVMDELMYNERPLELSAEGHSIRAIDMRRWQDITYNGKPLFDIKQRFVNLSNETYYLDDYIFPIPIKAPSITNPNKILSKVPYWIRKEGVDIPSQDSGDDLPKEFDAAANNYTKEGQSYLPIPLSEIQYNQAKL